MMGNLMKAKFFKKKYIISAILLLVVIIGFVIAGGGEEAQIAKVERRDIVQEVVVTGKTKARNEVELGFDKNGRVARSYVEVGNRVVQGQVIAELDMGADLANLAKERALLAEEESGLLDEGKKIESAIREAFSAADNAVRNKADQFFKTPRTNPNFEVKFSDGNYVHYFSVPSDIVIELNSNRFDIEITLNKFQAELLQLNSSDSKNFVSIALERINTVSNFLNKVAYAVNSFAPANFAYEATVTGYKTAIDSARNTVATARDGVLSASGAGEERVNQIKSSISSLEAELRKSRITAPFGGTVSRQDADVGEIAQAGEIFVSVISENDMYIEANVSEINIGKVAAGNVVKIEFDAYPGEKFQGTVTFIDPGETVVDEVVNYKLRIEINNPDVKIRSGLTAGVTIASAEKKDVLSIPTYAVMREDGKMYVNKFVEKKIIEKVEITTGITGSDGYVEVLSGLSESDTVHINGSE
ncbi:MAG TPA: efflux RND transporter periplasmic adaptor subunit [Candidatus Paceibacterota bacterium]